MNGIEAGLSLGSNLDDKLASLQAARAAIAALPQVTVLASAPIYETEPVGVPAEFANLAFYNTVLIIGTSLDTHKLFAQLQKIESTLGRKRTLRQNMPRTIDVDLIYYDGQTIRSGGLVVAPQRKRRPQHGAHRRACGAHRLRGGLHEGDHDPDCRELQGCGPQCDHHL